MISNMLGLLEKNKTKQEIHVNIVVLIEGSGEGTIVLWVAEFSGVTCMAMNISSPW